MTQADHIARRAAEMVARQSYGKLVAFLSARTRDVARAEDSLADAFAAALVDWPARGVPDNPEAWLMTAARRKLIDLNRRRQSGQAALPHLVLMAEEMQAAETAEIPDQRLALLCACAHPAIEASIRVPLMLQVVLGLSADTIAAAFLTSPAAMGKRLVRAKEKIKAAGISFQLPEREALPQRRDALLAAIYAGFAEGWGDPEGLDAARAELASEAIFLSRLVVHLLPDEPEALGLCALLLHAEARRPARRGDTGDFVPLAEQDPTLWQRPMITEAQELLARALAFNTPGRYQIEAAIQSAHAFRRLSGADNWADIVALYDALFVLEPSPVVTLNRALALGEAEGPAAGLAALPDDKRLAAYQPFWAARAELLARTGANGEARRAYDIAIGLASDPAVRRFLLTRAAQLAV